MRKGERTKQHVIETTSLLLNKRGYLSTPLSEITEATGLQKGGLYNHFRDKEELSLESFGHNCRAVEAIIRDRLNAAPPGSVERLMTYIEAYCLMDYPGGCPIANVVIEAEAVSEPLFGRAKAAMDDILGFIEATIADGVASGEMQPGIEPREAALFLFSAVEGGILLRKLYPDAMDSVLDRIRRFIDTELSAVPRA
ncbi:transcriptional regulator, TetR family [Paenibacillus sp. UNC496MF]|uniref:TetR/AcrR family transcriptional regulator n=1 Tax=Paenibacillus sp. UNC496MF TaxID=1502753 RepID=UPI0008F25D93|nr:TetR/AcrR family transcriptional regulator [Paenibacillus sp. UNC496MF]SFI36693.1 transcriptional regulator, TetR family [Paenibacillus sp. UNC496MF]